MQALSEVCAPHLCVQVLVLHHAGAVRREGAAVELQTAQLYKGNLAGFCVKTHLAPSSAALRRSTKCDVISANQRSALCVLLRGSHAVVGGNSRHLCSAADCEPGLLLATACTA